MLDKELYIQDTPKGREFFRHECKTFTGVCWDGGNAKRFAHTGRHYENGTPGFLGFGKPFGDMGCNVTTPPMMDPVCLDGHTVLKNLG